MTINPIQILLVDDSEDDIEFMKEALEFTKISNEIDAVNDGVEAMKYLRKSPPYQNAHTPDLILLDLNMPKKDGREVLIDIKTDDKLKSIPVIILSTSKREEDIHISYKHHANCYITKPVDFNQFTQIVKSLEDFWFTVVRLPKN